VPALSDLSVYTQLHDQGYPIPITAVIISNLTWIATFSMSLLQ